MSWSIGERMPELEAWMHARRWYRGEPHPLYLRARADFACSADLASGADFASDAESFTLTWFIIEAGAALYNVPLLLAPEEGGPDETGPRENGATYGCGTPDGSGTPDGNDDAAPATHLPTDATPVARARGHLIFDATTHPAGQRFLFEAATGQLGSAPAASAPAVDSPAGSNANTRPGANSPTAASALHLVTRPAGFPGSYRSARPLSGEQSNSSIIYQTSTVPLIIKLFRVLSPGANPDVELQAALSDTGTVPAQWGSAALVGGPAEASSDVLVAQEFLTGAHDAWRVVTSSFPAADKNAASAPSTDTPPAEPDQAAALLGDFAARIRDLGTLTRTFHTALAARLGTTAATPQLREAQLASWHSRARAALAAVPELEQRSAQIAQVFAAAAATPWPTLQRIHGDYHLGQVVDVPGRGWVALDFEGEPLRPLPERVAPDLALRDVAGMLRSFDYAGGQGERDGQPAARMRAWTRAAEGAFLAGYGAIPTEHQPLLRALLLDKALYEVVYEVNQRPDWIDLPLGGVHRLLEN
ncbi:MULTISPECIES: hypothetical protein [Actinotignum]|uniref:Maltokinase n=7 Tax=Bacillati TaxID=1783272 RepID=A0ABU5GE74_9ACTO|nr:MULTISPECIES: hypothetical protein [Actinotignum]MBS5748558.1 hypothetical protein [Actinotignum schaalii]MDE1557656.1 hypothetical protein [Actinotignum schaalii]MDE1662584.1 hypothetical protein [Actinotignum schaalii]MDK6373816.1 hypothetical protein [Actinotignum timonense]MDK6418090.1 hypothetical protein [Actinotignum timonense]